MEYRLKEYGFRANQIKKLVGGEILNTVHGQYKIIDDELALRRCDSKVFVLVEC